MSSHLVISFSSGLEGSSTCWAHLLAQIRPHQHPKATCLLLKQPNTGNSRNSQFLESQTMRQLPKSTTIRTRVTLLSVWHNSWQIIIRKKLLVITLALSTRLSSILSSKSSKKGSISLLLMVMNAKIQALGLKKCLRFRAVTCSVRMSSKGEQIAKTLPSPVQGTWTMMMITSRVADHGGCASTARLILFQGVASI